MPQQHNALLVTQEGRIELGLQAYQAGEFQTYRCAAEAFDVNHHALTKRAKGTPFRLETPLNCQKLTLTEEQTIVQYILNLDSQGFSPRLHKVADIADKLLAARGGELVGKN
jgi:hypothetical protein